MDVYIQSTNAECNQYMPDGKKPEQVAVIISPLRIEGEEGHLKVISGCNLWLSCQNPGCFFSRAAREHAPKLKASK